MTGFKATMVALGVCSFIGFMSYSIQIPRLHQQVNELTRQVTDLTRKSRIDEILVSDINNDERQDVIIKFGNNETEVYFGTETGYKTETQISRELSEELESRIKDEKDKIKGELSKYQPPTQ